MNLLSRTRRLLQGLAASAPATVQYYSVACPEGHRLRGQRTEGYQALRCPTCGEGMFVLPRSPLPDPPAPEPSRRRETNESRESAGFDEGPVHLSDPVLVDQQGDVDVDVDGEIEWLDPAPPADAGDTTTEIEFEEPVVADRPKEPPAQKKGPERPRRPTPNVESGHRAAARPRASGQHAGRPSEVATETRTVAVPAPVSERLAEWARRKRNPLIFTCVVLLVVFSAGFRLWRSRFQDLPRIAAIGREEGLAALDAGKFDTAYQLLSQAKSAVEALGDAVEGASDIRQGADEAAILAHLSPESLETILTEASADEAWTKQFNNLYRGKAIIIDANILKAPDASGAGSYELDYRVFPNGKATDRVGRIEVTNLGLFAAAPKSVGDHVVFGARLASVALDTEHHEWVIRLEPQSGVFMLHTKALEVLFGPDYGKVTVETDP